MKASGWYLAGGGWWLPKRSNTGRSAELPHPHTAKMISTREERVYSISPVLVVLETHALVMNSVPASCHRDSASFITECNIKC